MYIQNKYVKKYYINFFSTTLLAIKHIWINQYIQV